MSENRKRPHEKDIYDDSQVTKKLNFGALKDLKTFATLATIPKECCFSQVTATVSQTAKWEEASVFKDSSVERQLSTNHDKNNDSNESQIEASGKSTILLQKSDANHHNQINRYVNLY